MKKTTTLLALVTVLASSSLSAQTRLGVTAGASFANVTVKIQGLSASPTMKTGITTGFFADVPLSKNFNFQPALNFVQKGYRIKDETGTENVTFNYLELPLNFVYNTKQKEGFFIGAGPSIAFGLSGKTKFKYSDAGMSDDIEKIKFGSGSEEVKALDFGLNALIGYKVKGGLVISGNYNSGLSNLANKSTENPGDNASIKNRYFAVKIGYIFSSNKGK